MGQSLQITLISQKVIPCLRVFTITSRQVGLVDKSSFCRRDCLHSNKKETPAGVIRYT